MTREDYYSILGITQNATIEEIKERFKYLAFVYHPDRFTELSHKMKAEEDFKKINEAYSALLDNFKRQKYDEIRNKKEKKETNRQDSAKTSSTITREDVVQMINKVMNSGSVFPQKINLINLDLS